MRRAFILDTNALWNDYFLSSPSLVTLAREQPRCGYALSVPEVAIREHIRHFVAEREELLAEHRKLEGRLANISKGRLTKLSLKPSPEAFETELAARLKDLGIHVLGYPKVSNEALVARAVRNRRPFSGKKQQGLHDVLIWENVLQVAVSGNFEEVTLVSGDSAFGDDSLHPDLEEEVTERGGCIVSLLKSIREAIDRHVSPFLEAIANLKAELNGGVLAGFVDAWLRENVDRELSSRDFTRKELGLQRSQYWGGYWAGTRRIVSAVATDVGRTEQGLAIVRFKVRVEGEMTYAEYLPDSVRFDAFTSTDYLTEARAADVELEWLFDREKKEVASYSIIGIKWL